MESDPSSQTPRRASLFAQIVRWRVRGPDGGTRIGAVIALLLGLGPVLTIAGAYATTRSIRAETATLAASAEPRLTAQRRAEAARDTLRRALSPPALAVTLDALARALPPESMLAGVERRADGTLVVEAITTDPDQLRDALRRNSATAMLRDAGQRRRDAAMLVTFEGRAQ